MPITQDRLLRLLAIADSLQAHIDTTRQMVSTLDQQLKSEDMTKAQAYDSLANIIAEAPLPTEAYVALERERTHFAATSRRNDQAREYLRRLRSGENTLEGLAPGPQSIARFGPKARAAAEVIDLNLDTIADTSKPLDNDGSGIDYAAFRLDTPDSKKE